MPQGSFGDHAAATPYPRPLWARFRVDTPDCRQRIATCQTECILAWGVIQQARGTIDRTRQWLAASRASD
jgi:hypothetical protein